MHKNFQLSSNDIWQNTEYWKENTEEDYVNCIQNIIKSKPFGNRKFYIFSFVKRVDDLMGIKKMYHQPRLTKPEPVPGTTLMRVDPRDPDKAVIIWTLPNQENFHLYKYGKLFGDMFVHDCVDKFLNRPEELMQREQDDLSDEQIREAYQEKRRTKV